MLDLAASVPHVNALLLGGDYVDEGDGAALALLCEGLARFDAPKLGVWGNHDHDGPSGIEEIGPKLAGAGVHMLGEGETAHVGELTVAGLASISSGERLRELGLKEPGLSRQTAHQLLSDALVSRSASWDQPIDEARTVVLGHEPALALVHGARLHLAGHSHWGQTTLPALRKRMLPIGSEPYPQGCYDLSGGRTVYTSAGAGHHQPGRIGTRPEVVVIDC